MFRTLFSTGRNGSGVPALEPLAARKLQAALTRLPPEWLVLRSRYARGLDGPPWVKFIALHPQKGIALIDVAPADPEAAVEALDEFLARTGLDAFSRGDPPIVALALNPGDDVAAIDRYLADAFAAAAPCGIKNANWTEAVAELLLTTPGLLLTQIAPVPDMTVPDTPAPLTPPESERGEETTTPAPSVSPELPAIAAPMAAAAPDAMSLRDAVLRAEKDDTPVSIDDVPEIATKRQIWAVSGTFAASLVLGSIGLVYLDRPNGASTVLIEAERAVLEAHRQAPPAAPPATTALATTPATPSAEEVAASVAGPTTRAAPSPRQQRQAVLATRPPWEDAKANGKTKTATASRAALRKQSKQRRSDDLPKEVFTAVNNWFLEVQSSVRSVIR